MLLANLAPLRYGAALLSAFKGKRSRACPGILSGACPVL